MTGPLVAGLLAGYGVALPVGPVGAYLVGLAARAPWRVGVAAGLGVATADGLYALLAVLGGAALTAVIALVGEPLRWVSVAVLLLLALRTVRAGLRPTSARGCSAATSRSPYGTYLRLLGVTLVNPTTVVYFATVVTGARAGAAVPLPGQLLFALAAFAASASWQLALVCGGSLLGRRLSGGRGRAATALVSGAVVAVLALRLAAHG